MTNSEYRFLQRLWGGPYIVNRLRDPERFAMLERFKEDFMVTTDVALKDFDGLPAFNVVARITRYGRDKFMEARRCGTNNK